MNTHIIMIMSMIVCATCPPPATIKFREIITRPKATHNFMTLLRKVTTTFKKNMKVAINNHDKDSPLDNHLSDEFFSHEHSIDDDVNMFFINKKYSMPKSISTANFREVIQSDVADLPLKVLINGWSSDNSIFYHTLIPAYVSSAQRKVNVLLVDWTGLDRENNYPKSALITAVVGQKVAALLGTLVKNKAVKFEDIHLIGYSMGAHIAAIVGEKLKTGLGAATVGRITGLDPVYPCRENSPVVDNCLNKSRAVFVDVIHTFTAHESSKPPIGTVDFFLKINSDWRTKATRSNLLETNELKTVELFSESIKNKNVVRCCDWKYSTLSSCNSNEVIVMGEHANDKHRGKLFCHLPTEDPAKVEIDKMEIGQI